ncbi:MAG: hypothetical protein E7039_01195 [Lentisphaerae bacterium]|nr:hypothetical protein [Lentisphaerota bacterium]
MRRIQAARTPILSHIFPYSPILFHKKAATHHIARSHGVAGRMRRTWHTVWGCMANTCLPPDGLRGFGKVWEGGLCPPTAG